MIPKSFLVYRTYSRIRSGENNSGEGKSVPQLMYSDKLCVDFD